MDFPPTHANFPPGHALAILEPCQNILEPPTIHCQFAVHPFGTTTTTPTTERILGENGKKDLTPCGKFRHKVARPRGKRLAYIPIRG